MKENQGRVGEFIVENIKALCKERNMKISDLESMVGLSKGNISRWAKSCPTAIVSLILISKILNVSVDYLLEKNENKPNKAKNDTLDYILENTKNDNIKWVKISRTRAKSFNIPSMSYTNDYVYNNEIFAYEANLKDYHLVFLHRKMHDEYILYLENNNEYIPICENNSFCKEIFKEITKSKDSFVSDFFNEDFES